MTPFPARFTNWKGPFWITLWADTKEKAIILGKAKAAMNYRKGWSFEGIGE